MNRNDALGQNPRGQVTDRPQPAERLPSQPVGPGAGPTDEVPAPVNGAEAPRPLVGGWRAVYLPHGWIATPRPEAQIVERIQQLAPGGFTHQLHNVGMLDPTGRVPPAVSAGLAAWVTTSRRVVPGQQVLAWVSGSETTHVDNPGTWQTVAESVAALVTSAGVDGVLLDMEPFSADNRNYLGLLKTLRLAIPATWLGVTAPMAPDTWSPGFSSELSHMVDAVSPMAYDSSAADGVVYAHEVAQSLLHYRASMSGRTQILPSLPAYRANRWHDPSVENLNTVRTAIEAVGGIEGAAVYWWWEMAADDLEAWRRLTS